MEIRRKVTHAAVRSLPGRRQGVHVQLFDPAGAVAFDAAQGVYEGPALHDEARVPVDG